jgi:hypothetical protein
MHCIIFLVGILQSNIALDLNHKRYINIYFSISLYREVIKAAKWRPFERAILYYQSSSLVE